MTTECTFVIAVPADAHAIAALHADSWRNAYRGMLPDAFLDGPLDDNRRRLWEARMASPSDRRLVLKAVRDASLVGFVCVFLDGEPGWGAHLDNLHVRPAERGQGIGARLLRAAREWVARRTDGPMYLWVLDANVGARRFYERHGGVAADARVGELAPGIEAPETRYVWR